MRYRGAAFVAMLACVCTMCGCATMPQALSPEQAEAYDIAARLMFITRTELRSGESLTDSMRVYLASDPCVKLTDMRGRSLAETAFASCRKAVAMPSGYQKGYSHGASQQTIVQVCLYYKLPGFESKPPLKELFGKLNALAERGASVFGRSSPPTVDGGSPELSGGQDTNKQAILDAVRRSAPAVARELKRSAADVRLHDAVRSNDTAAARILLDEGASPTSNANSQGWKLLHVAVSHNNTEMARMLISAGASVDVPDWHDGITPLHLAVLMKHPSTNMVALLLDNTKRVDEPTDDEYWVSFGVSKYDAPKYGFGDMRMRKNPQFRSRVPQGATALHLAALRADKGIVELLLKHGASKTARNAEGRTPGKVASLAGNREIAELLTVK